jgi:hypothetical protein
MANIPFATVNDAEARSREMWEAYLGRPKNAEDVTESLYAPSVDAESGDVSLHIPERDPYLDKLLREDQMKPEEIAALVNLYPAWEPSGASYQADDLVAHENELYKVVQAHTSQPDWQPDQVPALFVNVAPKGVIPEWIQPQGAHDAYALDALVTHSDKVWRSTVVDNVWEPGVYGWEEIV